MQLTESIEVLKAVLRQDEFVCIEA